MNMFATLTNDGLEKQEDRLGGGGLLDTGLYQGIIKLAYAGASKGGAKFVQLLIDIAGREYRETVYVTNRAGHNYYMNNDKKVPLPGFSLIDNICLLTTDTPLAEAAIEEKVVKIYDYEERKELPQNVPVLIDLLQKPIALAIVNQLENKSAQQPDGSYLPTAEERSVNLIEKVFHHENMLTVTEALNGLSEGEFHAKWLEKNEGKVRDKRTVTGSAKLDAVAKAPATSSTAAAPKRSLFGNKG